MGYTTTFKGKFNLNRKLDKILHDYLIKFSQTRRMARKVSSMYGVEGEFYVDGSGSYGQGDDKNIIDHNHQPKTQPSLWCQWRPTNDGMGIEWDGGEKFYAYETWIVYIIAKILAPNGYVLNGKVKFQGEEKDDSGIIVIENNRVAEL